VSERQSAIAALLTGVACLLLGGCVRARPPAPPAAQDSDQQATSTAPIVRVIELPTLGGPETCFNATDDNDNRLIDEGCDVRQGDVHFMIAWPEAEVDVDLLVTDPSGSLAGTEAPSALGLVLSDDCPRAGGACSGQAFESVHLDSDEVPGGTYRVRVVVQGGLQGGRPLPVRFGVRLPGIAYAREIEFSRTARQLTVAFSVKAEAGVGSPSE
jgi:hypothetical protein